LTDFSLLDGSTAAKLARAHTKLAQATYKNQADEVSNVSVQLWGEALVLLVAQDSAFRAGAHSVRRSAFLLPRARRENLRAVDLLPRHELGYHSD